MEAIKKKMQAMKLEKDNAMDRADLLEQQAKDANLRAEKVRSSMQETSPEPEMTSQESHRAKPACDAHWCWIFTHLCKI